MRPLRGSLWCCALAVLAIGGGTAQAAWDNVFQVCCFGCRHGSTSGYAPVVAAAQACPQPCQQCTTRYEQRSYYQPVTTYVPYTYTEPVTTYRTSYFWEPVTTYRYSCYYDPCSCSYKQVATPQQSYSLKSQCCPVTSYLERTALKAVCTQQLVTYYQPITTCCTTQMGAPISTLPPGAQAAPAAGDQGGPPPAVGNPPPAAGDRTLPGGSDTSRKVDSAPRTLPRATDGSSFRPPNVQPQPVNPTPSARIDRIAMLSEHEVQGQVLTTAAQPRAGARVLLVSKDEQNVKQTVTADEKGQFHVCLTAGAWLVYVHDAEGTAVYHDVLEVGGDQAKSFVLTSR
jgi:hypothetical protein